MQNLESSINQSLIKRIMAKMLFLHFCKHSCTPQPSKAGKLDKIQYTRWGDIDVFACSDLQKAERTPIKKP